MLTALFAAAATVFGPFASSARSRNDDPTPELVTRDGKILIGRTLGRDYRLTAHATSDGVRYTVTNLRGHILAQDMEAADVYRQFPDLDPGNLHTGPDEAGGRLMMVDPDQ